MYFGFRCYQEACSESSCGQEAGPGPDIRSPEVISEIEENILFVKKSEYWLPFYCIQRIMIVLYFMSVHIVNSEIKL